LRLLPGAAGDEIVEVSVSEHHFFALSAATDGDVPNSAAADETAKCAN
jgi:hypothetical protein